MKTVLRYLGIAIMAPFAVYFVLAFWAMPVTGYIIAFALAESFCKRFKLEGFETVLPTLIIFGLQLGSSFLAGMFVFKVFS